MTVYLPIAEMSVNALVLFSMGITVGFLSGLFGIGGGFLMTPLLIFYNVPPAIAVATGANQIVASSITGVIAHFRKGTVDFKLGTLLLIGGLVGAAAGVAIFSLLRRLGQLDLIVGILYVVFLSSIGTLMLIESRRARRKLKAGGRIDVRRPGQHNWIHGLPLKMRFRKSKLFLSSIPILVLGAVIGFLTAVMGVGGGFIMVPAMIYLLHVPTTIVIGTSLFQIIFVTAFTTVLQSTTNNSVDIVLAFILMLGGVIGAQLGAISGTRLRADQLRALLALLVLAVGLRLGYNLIVTPSELYSIVEAKDHGA